MPEMTPVRSSNIAEAGYDEESDTMTVTFRNGSTYTYSGVGKTAFDDLLTSPSPGSYLNRWIKNRHETTRIR